MSLLPTVISTWNGRRRRDVVFEVKRVPPPDGDFEVEGKEEGVVPPPDGDFEVEEEGGGVMSFSR